MPRRVHIDVAQIERLPPGQRAAAIKALEELEDAYAWNPLMAYEPASCRDVHADGEPCTEACKHSNWHASRAYSKWIFGGNRAGKTTTAIADDLIQATPAELLPPDLLRVKTWECPFYCRVMAPDMNRTMIPVIWQKLREWTPKALFKGGSFDKSIDKGAMSLRLECGCRFDFLSYEMDLDKFGGAALHRCHYDEEPPASIRRECLMRLVDFNGDEVGSMTPLKGLGWTYKEIWKKGSSDPNIFSVQIGLNENPNVSAEARDRILASIADPRERAARADGAFVHFGGLVYPDWRHALVKPLSIQKTSSWEKQISIDPCVRFAGLVLELFDDDNRCYVPCARKLTDAVAPDYASTARQMLALHAPGKSFDDVHFVIDPAARQRNNVNAESIMDELERYGMLCNPGQNAVEPGIKQVRRRMKSGWLQIADPERGGDTEALTEELEMYRLEVDPDDDDGQFKTIKQHDHVCDALRYGVMERPWLPELDDSPAEDRLPWWEVARPPRPRAQNVSAMGWGA